MVGTTGRAARAAALVLGLLVVPGHPAGADGNETPGNPLQYRQISAGDNHTCAISNAGKVKCWGRNDRGQLGLGDTANRGDGPNEMGADLPYVDLGPGRTATAVSTGNRFSCAVLDDGSVKCWGHNDQGQLGQGDTAARGDQPGEMGADLTAVDLGTGRTATAVTAANNHVCALLDDGTVKCWGYHGGGILGQGDRTSRGDNPGEMGDALPVVALGAGRTATSISGNLFHTCALLDDGSVKCWGFNGDGELGLGDTGNRGDGPGEMGDALPAVDLGTGRTALAVSAGGYQTCVLLDDATVKCWGRNDEGQLGLGDTDNRGDGPSEMGDALPAVELGSGRTPTAVLVGARFACAQLDDGTLKCWGDNADGQLGRGDVARVGDQPGEMGDQLPPIDLGSGRTVVASTAGVFHVCATLDTARLKCWGSNGEGRLGLGTASNRGDQPNEMGDALPVVELGIDPAISLSASVDAATHFTGHQVTFGFEVANVGDEPLTGVHLIGTQALTCDPLPDTLAVHATVQIGCSHQLTADDVGTVTAAFAVDSDQTPPRAANQLVFDVFPDRAVDAALKQADHAYIGVGVVNDDATDQTLTVGRQRGGRASFRYRITNDGDTAARYDLRRVGSDPSLTVRYYRTDTGADITSLVTGRTYRTPRLLPGASTTIRVEVTISATARRLVDHDVTLRSRSQAAATQADTARIRVDVT